MTFTQHVLQASKHNTSQHRQQSLRDSARHRLTHTPSQASVQQSRESSRQQREDAAMQQVLQAAPAILQDLAANVAEAVAVCYLAEARSVPVGITFSTFHFFHCHDLQTYEGNSVPSHDLLCMLLFWSFSEAFCVPCLTPREGTQKASEKGKKAVCKGGQDLMKEKP